MKETMRISQMLREEEGCDGGQSDIRRDGGDKGGVKRREAQGGNERRFMGGEEG